MRNRIAYLLQQRMGLARRAARFVFRDYPKIIRIATSSYERRRRAAYRRAMQKKEQIAV